MAKGEKGLAEEKKLEVASLKIFLQPVNKKLSEIENALHDDLIKLPNLPHISVPPGKTPEENEIVRGGGEKPTLLKVLCPIGILQKNMILLILKWVIKLPERISFL